MPVEIGSPSFRVINYNEQTNTKGLGTNLDMLDEARDQDALRITDYKQKTITYFEKKVKLDNTQRKIFSRGQQRFSTLDIRVS